MKYYLAYHKEHSYGPFGGQEFFTSKSVNERAICFVVSGHKIDKAVKYRLEGKYQISSVMSNNLSGDHHDKKWRLRLKPLSSLMSARIPLINNEQFDESRFHEKFTSGLGVVEIKDEQKPLVELFDRLLHCDEEHYSTELLEDLADIDREISDATEKETLRKARLGQGRFRRNVIHTWGGDEHCALTRVAIPELLNASHIIPWREADNTQRLSGANGILLSAHIDRLFDRYLIGFERTDQPDIYRVKFSKKLHDRATDLRSIGLTKDARLDLTMVKFVDKPKLEEHLKSHLRHVDSNA